jgi:hypothetical protein
VELLVPPLLAPALPTTATRSGVPLPTCRLQSIWPDCRLIRSSNSLPSSVWLVRKIASPQITGVLSPHSGKSHFQATLAPWPTRGSATVFPG